jgi:hypothetical protein
VRGTYPDSLNAVRDEIQERGGGEAYLTAIGVAEVELASLRAHVIAPATR